MNTKFVKFVPITDENKCFETEERRYGDEIFINRPLHNAFNDDNIVRNEHYSLPDYTRHVFSNMGKGLYCLDERNIATPIREFTDISSFGIKYLSKEDNDANHSQGVYIVERHNIYDITSVNVEALMRYYRQVSDITEETVREIERKIFKCTPSNYVTIRIVTYIPKKDINYYKYIYSPKTNTCIIKGVPHRNVSHPKAIIRQQIEDENTLLANDHSTLLSLDIIDSNNPYKPYYMVIGNNVERIISNPSTLKPNGVKITVKKDNVIINDKTDYGLGELNKIGIYDSEDKAIFKGDMSALLDRKKLDLEDSKLEINKKKILQENNKIHLSYKQIDHEVFIQNLEKEIKVLNYQTLVFKADHEYNVSLLNMERETIIFEQKYMEQQIKTINGYLSLGTTVIKSFSALI